MLAQQKKLQAQVRGEVPQPAPALGGTLPPAEKAQPNSKVVHLKDWQVRYYHNDHLGTPRELSSDDGQIVWQATYKAWGNTLKVERPAAETLQKQERLAQAQQAPEAQNDASQELWEAEQNLRFQGQYFDSETGLHYNRFRYYDPDVGRFVSQDPIGLLGGVNLFAYALNPSGWVDPLGLTCWGSLLEKAGIPKPDGMKRPHGHHIVFKGDFDRVPKMKAALGDSRAVVEKYGIDPVNDVGALIWAPNEAHTVKNAELVAKKLQEADAGLIAKGIDPKSECGKIAMFQELQRIGKEVFIK